MISTPEFYGTTRAEAMEYIRNLGFHISTSENTVHCPSIFDNTQSLPEPVLRAIAIIFDAGLKAKNQGNWKRDTESPIKSVLCQFKRDDQLIAIWNALDAKHDNTGTGFGNMLRDVIKPLANLVSNLFPGTKGDKAADVADALIQDKDFSFNADMNIFSPRSGSMQAGLGGPTGIIMGLLVIGGIIYGVKKKNEKEKKLSGV